MRRRPLAEYKRNYTANNRNILLLIEALCDRFIENGFACVDRGIHPVIYYKFMIILEDWKPEFPKPLIDRLTTKLQDKFNIDKLRKKYESPVDGYFRWFMDELYEKGKYELYRQISLYNAEDETLFDVKKLVYSLLIVRRNGHYRNNMIIDEALEIISKEQYKTGLLPIGLIVNNDFVKTNTKPNKVFEDRKVGTTPPILSSFECFSDMLSSDDIREDLKKNYKEYALAFYWTKKRIRKN